MPKLAYEMSSREAFQETLLEYPLAILGYSANHNHYSSSQVVECGSAGVRTGDGGL